MWDRATIYAALFITGSGFWILERRCRDGGSGLDMVRHVTGICNIIDKHTPTCLLLMSRQPNTRSDMFSFLRRAVGQVVKKLVDSPFSPIWIIPLVQTAESHEPQSTSLVQILFRRSVLLLVSRASIHIPHWRATK